MANEAIATVVAVAGKAYARNADGELREIRPGDVLLAGETVVTPDGGQVELSLVDGSPFFISDVAQMTVSRDLLAGTAASAGESAVEDDSVEALLAALEGDGDIGDVLEATAAGSSGGGEGGGHNWVRLGRIVESTSEFTGLASTQSAGLEAPVEEQHEAIIAVDAVDDIETTVEGVPVVVEVQQNDAFLEGSIVTSVTQAGNGAVVINADNTVTYTPDDGFIGEDTFTYTAISPDGSNGDTAVVSIVVTGDPAPPPSLPQEDLPTLSIGDVTVLEGGVGTLTVALSAPSEAVVSVAFASVDDSATVTGGDYNPGTGEITFAPGQTTTTIQLQTNTDDLQEGTEQFVVNLSNASGAEIADGQGVVLIIEPEPLPVISINDVTVAEGAAAQLTLSLSSASDGAVSVQFASADDTATVSGADYNPATGTVTFAPGQTEVILTYQTNSDNLEEASEQFVVNLSSAINATIADDQGVVQIVDATEPPPPPPPPVPENATPTVSVTDGEVDEAALDAGSNAASSAETTTGSFNIATGVEALGSLTVGGQDVTDGGTVAGQYGALTVTAAGGAYSWTYTLSSAAGHSEADSTGTAEGIAENFAVIVADDDGDTASTNLVIDILDDGPSAAADINTATENGPVVSGNVLPNDMAGADGAISVSGLTGGSVGDALSGSFGSLVLQVDGSYSYTPNANVPAGSQDVFAYEITDGDGDTASTTLTLRYAGDGSAPTADNGSAATGDTTLGSDTGSLHFNPGTDTPVSFAATYDGGLGAAIQSSDGTATTIAAQDGSWTLEIDEASGDYNFVQNTAYHHEPGADSDSATVTVTLSDSDGSTVQASLALTVADDGPSALADGNTGTEGGPEVTGNVISNDLAGADGAISVTALSGGSIGEAMFGSFGSLLLRSDGSYTYQPSGSVPAGSQDAFSYEITDADGDTSSTTLTIAFDSDNSVPTITSASAATADDTLGSVSGSLAFNPGTDTPVSFAASYDGGLGGATEASAGGITTFTADDGSWALDINESSGDYTFTQNAIYDHRGVSGDGSGAVTVTLTDSDGSVVQGNLALSIVDDAPVANNDGLVELAEDDGLTNINVFANDTAGADGVDLTTGVNVLSGTANGTLLYRNDGTFDYLANAGFTGEDQFTYQIIDSDGDTDTATVSIAVGNEADPPLASISVEYMRVEGNNITLSVDEVLGGRNFGDDNINGTGGVNYTETYQQVIQLGQQFAGATVDLEVSADIRGSWNWDGSGNYFEDNWALSVNGDFFGEFWYNSNNTGNEGVIQGPNGPIYTHGTSGTVNNNVSFTDVINIKNVTLDQNGNAVLNFSAASTQTSETVNIDTIASLDLPDTHIYHVDISAGLTDPEEVLTVRITGAETGSLTSLTGNSTVTDLGNGEWSVAFTPVTAASITDRLELSIFENTEFQVSLVATSTDGLEQSVTTVSAPAYLDGVIVDGVVQGMHFETSSGFEGMTGDDGSFQYRAGDTISFRVGSVILGSFSAEAMADDGKVFLQEIAGTQLNDLNDDYVENMAVFLQSLDNDADAYNGIVISQQMHEVFSGVDFDLATMSEAGLQQALTDAGMTPVSETDAMQHVRDMLTEHAGITEFEEHVSDAPTLLASGGDDVFAFALDDSGEAGENTTIMGFADDGRDTLDLRDLLLGEEADEADLTSYLNVSSDGTDTVIQVSVNGEFGGSAADVSHIDQSITLAGVDLVSGHDDLNSVIQNMLDSGKLNVDQ